MNPAAPDDAPGAAPTPALGTRREAAIKRQSSDWGGTGSSGLIAALCSLDFVKLKLRAHQTAGELARLSLLLALAPAQLILDCDELLVGWLQHHA